MFFPERSVDIPEDTLCPDSSEPTVVASETQQTDMSSTAEVATTSVDNGVTIKTSNPVATTDEVASSNTNTIAATKHPKQLLQPKHYKQSTAKVFNLQKFSLRNLCSPRSWNKPRLSHKDAAARTEVPQNRKAYNVPVNAPMRSLETNATVSALLGSNFKYCLV